MESSGVAFGRLYFYDDDDYEIGYLDSLSVDESHRNLGIGTQLQVLREEKARELGAQKIKLWVKIDSWQQRWYERRGYYYVGLYQEEGFVWMEKNL
jgi:GNAT superfamily N-acetyltransferase